MTECSNAIHDVLPDYLHQQLSAGEALTVEQHLVTCAACASDVALLRTALSVRPHGVSVDVVRIIANLPRASVGAEPAPQDAKIRALSSAPSVTRKSGGALDSLRNWRAAAAIVIVALGGMSVATLQRTTRTQSSAQSSTDSAQLVATTGETIRPSAVVASAVTPTVDAASAAALPVGELSDYSDAEIETVIQRLDKWDGAAAADPLPGVPLLPVSTGIIP